MTTTLRANAQELQVSTTVEENARDAPAWTLEQQGRIVPANNRHRAGEASIRSSEEQDRSRHHSAHRGGLELSPGTGLYGACRSTQCCMAVWSRWVESSTLRPTRLGGFRALKKTPEAPYTIKVNYRKCTSRGTTQIQIFLIYL